MNIDINEYKHKYLNTQHVSIRKTSLLYSIYDGVTRGAIVSNVGIKRVGLAGQAVFTYQALLCEQLPQVYVFSAHKIFTLCVPFPNRISHFKILATP